MSDDTSGLACFHSFSYSTDDTPLSALLQLNDEQRSRWQGLLTLIETAANHRQVDRHAGLADGYAQGLRDARILTHEQCDELREQMHSREMEAGIRVDRDQV